MSQSITRWCVSIRPPSRFFLLYGFFLYLVHLRGQIWCRCLNVSLELGCPLHSSPSDGWIDNPVEAGHCGIAFKKSGERKKKNVTVMSCCCPGRAHRCDWGRRWGGSLRAVGAIGSLFIPLPDNLRNTRSSSAGLVFIQIQFYLIVR